MSNNSKVILLDQPEDQQSSTDLTAVLRLSARSDWHEGAGDQFTVQIATRQGYYI